MPGLIPGATAGTATGYLQRNELVGMLHLFWEQYFNARPLLGLFKERVRMSRTFIIKQFVNLLTTGTLTARPESGKRIDPTMMSKLFVDPHFDQYSIDLEPDQYLALSNPEAAPDDYFKIESVQEALTDLRQQFTAHIETYLRTLHQYICKVLSTPGGPTDILVSGEAIDLDWGFGTALFGADWITSTTNVQQEFGAMKGKFRRQSRGLDPNLIIINHNFIRTFIQGNDYFSDEILPRNNRSMKDFIDLLSMPIDNRDEGGAMKVVVVSDGVIDESSTPATGTADEIQDQWPLNIMTMAYVDPNDENFILNTVRTFDNEFAGGPNVDTYFKHAPKRAHLYFSGNYVPTWSDPSRVMICKVSNTTTAPYPSDIP